MQTRPTGLCYQQSKVGELPPRDSVYKAVWLPGGTCVWLCSSNVVIILLNRWLGNISKQSLEIFLESGDKTFPGSSCRSYVLDVHRFEWRHVHADIVILVTYYNSCLFSKSDVRGRNEKQKSWLNVNWGRTLDTTFKERYQPEEYVKRIRCRPYTGL